MRQDIILVANEGQTIPTPLSERTVKEHPNAMGVAYIDGDKGLYAGSETAGLTLEDFEGHQKEFSAAKRIYHFSKAEGEVMEGDLQPFVILKVGDENVVVAFIEGKFDVENDGQLTDAAVLAGTVLKDTLDDAWEISQQNVEKLEARMKGKTFVGEMERLCKPFKSTIAFMLSNGAVMIHSKSETQATAPWGFTSSMLGLKEGVFPAAEAAPVEKKKIGGIKPSPATSVPAVAPAPTVPAPAQVGGTVIHRAPTAAPAEVKTAAAVYNQPQMVWAVPRTDNARKIHDWYHKNNNGMVPSNYMQKPPIQMLKERALKQGNTKPLEDAKAEDKTYKAFSEIKPDEVKTVEPKPVIPATPSGPIEVIPVYPVDDVKKIDALIQNNKHVMNPDDLKKVEEKYPTFWKSHGISAEKTLQWPLNLRMDIARTSPLQAAHAWQNSDYQRKLLSESCLELMEENDKLKKQLEAATPAVAAEQPKRKIGGIRR